MTIRLGLAVMLAAASTTIASAEPFHVHAERCPSLDPVAIDVAVSRELALDPKVAKVAQWVVVILECPDELHARLRVEPEPRGGPLARDLDLAEEPAELRVKLVALAAAELIDIVATPELELAPPSAVPSAAVHDTEDVPDLRRSVAADSPGPKITLRAGIRIFADDQAPMPTITGDLDVGPIQVGLTTAIGNDNRFAGIPYVVTVAVSRRLVCSRGRTSVCLVARGELGFAGVSIRGDSATMMEHSIYAGYGGLALGFEVARQFHGWKGLAAVDLGGADGLVVEQPYLEHLDGPYAMTSIGVRW